MSNLFLLPRIAPHTFRFPLQHRRFRCTYWPVVTLPHACDLGDYGETMARAHLTDIVIRAIRPPLKGQVTFWDTTTRAFGVRLS